MPKAKPKKTQVAKWGLHAPWAQNVLQREWEDTESLNASLKQELWRMRALDPDGLYRSNMAGTWHSKDNLLRTTGESGEKLRSMFQLGMMQWAGLYGLPKGTEVKMNLAAWGMIYSDRGYATVHTHPNCHVSGVYYVDDTTKRDEITMATGVKVRSGDIEFFPPCYREFQIKGMAVNAPLILSFEAGRMLIFPSNLAHFVHPIRGEGERISIACNGTFTQLTKET